MRNLNLLLTIRGRFPIVAVACLVVAAATGAQETDPDIDVPARSPEYEQWLDTLQNGSVPQRVRAVSNLPAVDDESLVLKALQMAADAAWVELRTAAIFAIGKLGDKSAAPFLHEKLHASTPQVREAAIWALSTLEDDTAATPMADRLTDAVSSVREAAAWYFATVVAAEFREPLLKVLDDGSNEVRIAAVWGLAESASSELRAAARRMLNDPSNRVRVAAGTALAQSGDQGSVAAIYSALADRNTEVRKAMADALSMLDNPGGDIANQMFDGRLYEWDEVSLAMGQYAESFLVSVLRSEQGIVRQNAAAALAGSGSTQAIPALEEMARSGLLGDRVAAASAIADIRQQSIIGKSLRIAWAATTAGDALIISIVLVIGSTILVYSLIRLRREKVPVAVSAPREFRIRHENRDDDSATDAVPVSEGDSETNEEAETDDSTSVVDESAKHHSP